MSAISFRIKPEEQTLVSAIIKRCKPRSGEAMNLSMDLIAAHANGCPMDWQKLLDAPNFDFWHDINGIQRHINRDTGQLEDCFLPRCCAQKPLGKNPG